MYDNPFPSHKIYPLLPLLVVLHLVHQAAKHAFERADLPGILVYGPLQKTCCTSASRPRGVVAGAPTRQVCHFAVFSHQQLHRSYIYIYILYILYEVYIYYTYRDILRTYISSCQWTHTRKSKSAPSPFNLWPKMQQKCTLSRPLHRTWMGDGGGILLILCTCYKNNCPRPREKCFRS